MVTWGIEQCFLIFLMLLFLFTKRLFKKPCMEAINRSEKQFKEDPNGHGSQRDEPFWEECDGRKWRHINGRWILVWPRPLHRPKELEPRHRHHHRRRRHKPVVQKTGLEAIPEGLENELETKSEPEPEPELVGPYRSGTCWWMHALCLDDLENELEHPAMRVCNVPHQHELLQSRRPSGFKNLFLEPFRCCIGQGPVD